MNVVPGQYTVVFTLLNFATVRPEAVGTVVSAGATLDTFRNVKNNSVRSNAISLLNLQAGYRLAKNARLAVDVFNLWNAKDSDIDYFYASRLPGEPLDGVGDIHTHPTLPRTARVNLIIGF